MIEKIIKDYLSECLAPISVTMERPAELPDTYVLIEKTGSSLQNGIRTASVAIQSYGPSLYEAAALNEAVIEDMLRITTLDSVSACELDSDYNFTNTTTKQYRYQAVFDVAYI